MNHATPMPALEPRVRHPLEWLRLVVLPNRLMRLLALLVSSILVFLLFYLGSKPIQSGLFTAPWDKLVHYLFFGGLAGLFWVMLGGRLTIATVGALLMTAGVGFADEYVQASTPGRDSSIYDFAFDILGAITAVGILGLLRHALDERAGPDG